MYSKIPMPQADWDKENIKYMFCFFPFIGAVVGLITWLAGYAGQYCGYNGSFVAVVLTLIPVLITGGIHVDGLLDTSDALSSWQSRERRLEILKDSRVGAFAVLGCVSYLLLQYALWCQPGWEKEDLWVLALVPVLSRAMSGYGALTQPGARADGLLAAFTEQEQGRGRQRFLLFLCALLALAIGMLGVGCAAVAAAILVYLWYIQMARREFGGLTGDMAGWFLQVCELGCPAAMVLAREIAEVLI